MDETVRLTRELLQRSDVLSLFGFAGTANIGKLLAEGVLEQGGAALVAPYTGGESLRNPFNPWIFHVRAGYVDETVRLTREMLARPEVLALYGFAGTANIGKLLSDGVLLVTPVHWYQAASPLKLMMDRMVCADGGNPDPTSTHGKDPEKAKALELKGWDYPKHLAGRAYGVVVHGDVAGIESVRRALCDWLDWMGLVDAGSQARLDRFIGYYEPYATSHDTLDADAALHVEVKNAAHAVVTAVQQLREGELRQPDARLSRPRPK